MSGIRAAPCRAFTHTGRHRGGPRPERDGRKAGMRFPHPAV